LRTTLTGAVENKTLFTVVAMCVHFITIPTTNLCADLIRCNPVENNSMTSHLSETSGL
jgi:hypothetical protein